MSVRVVARIRPLLDKEADKDTIVRPDSTEAGKAPTIVKIPNPRNEGEDFSFAFNSVYDQPTTQETLFTSEGTDCPSRHSTRACLVSSPLDISQALLAAIVPRKY